MSTSTSFSYSYSLEHDPEAEDFTVKLNTSIKRFRIPGSVKRSFSFTVEEFIEEDDTPDKEELNYYLIEVGIDHEHIVEILIDLVLLACDAANSVGRDFRGVLVLSIDVVDVTSDEIGSQIKAARDFRLRRARKLVMNALSMKRFKKRCHATRG